MLRRLAAQCVVPPWWPTLRALSTSSGARDGAGGPGLFGTPRLQRPEDFITWSREAVDRSDLGRLEAGQSLAALVVEVLARGAGLLRCGHLSHGKSHAPLTQVQCADIARNGGAVRCQRGAADG